MRKQSPVVKVVDSDVVNKMILFTSHKSVTLPPRIELFSPAEFFVECPLMHIHPLFGTIVNTGKPEQPNLTRTYTIERLKVGANDNTIQTNLPPRVLITRNSEDLATGLPVISVITLGDIALILGGRAIGNPAHTKLVMHEDFPTLFYVRGMGGDIYVVGARWREHCKRWFLFARHFNDRGMWHKGTHVVFPTLSLQSIQ